MLSIALLPALAGSGCAGNDAAAPPAELERTTSALTSSNGLSFNGMSFNGMSFNGLSFNGLSFNGLSFNGLSFNGMSFNGMSFNGMSFNGLGDPAVQGFVSYLVQCALPADDAVEYMVDGQTHTFRGQLGLAPEWKNEACGPSCQRWVSACLLARLNKKGEHVPVSLRGEHRALKVEAKEVRDFPAREATYFGNLFSSPDEIYACDASGTGSIPRVCGPSVGDCPMNVVQPCDQACRPGRQRSFQDCSSGQGTYKEAITVFLRE